MLLRSRPRHHWFLCLCLTVSLNLVVAAQSTEDVHVRPLAAPELSPPASKEDSKLKVHTRPLRVDVDLVLVPVTVTDSYGKAVMDLHKNDFQLFEGKTEIPVRYFFSQDAPVSVGVLVDLSSSMKDKIDLVREAFDAFFNHADPADDYFVVTFADRPKLLADTTESIPTIQSQLAQMQAKGETALADAIYVSLEKLRHARYRRKALVIISDGGDNASRHTIRSVRNLAKEADAQVYAIDVCDAPSLLLTRKLEERFGRQWLTSVSQVSGGRTITVDDANQIPAAAAQISLELRNQYVLGFAPRNSARDGKWRKIKVKVTRPPDPYPLQLYYKTGYMARKGE